MKIALLSDVHDRTDNLLAALCLAEEHGCARLLYLGDIVELSTFSLLVEEWTNPLDVVFGNNEIDRRSFFRKAEAHPHVTHHGDEASVHIEQRLIYFSHYPWAAMKAAESGRYDAVFYGHTHARHRQLIAHTLLVNPGEVGGVRLSASFAIYDTDDNSVEFIHL